MNSKIQSEKKNIEAIEISRKQNIKPSMLMASDFGSKEMAIATEITVPNLLNRKSKKQKLKVRLFNS